MSTSSTCGITRRMCWRPSTAAPRPTTRPSARRRPGSPTAGSPDLVVSYALEDLPRTACLHFAVEINLAAMAGHAADRYYSDPAGSRLGRLDAHLDLPHTSGLNLTDEWLNLAVGLAWSQAA